MRQTFILRTKISSFWEVLGLCVKVEKGLDIWKDASQLFTLKEVSRKDLLENMKFLSAWVPTVQ